MAKQTFVSDVGSFGHVGNQQSFTPDYSRAAATLGDAIGGAIGEKVKQSAFSKDVQALDTAFASETQTIEEETLLAKTTQKAFLDKEAARTQELLKDVDPNDPQANIEASFKINEDAVIQQLRAERAKIERGVAQGVVSPLTEKARKLQLAKQFKNRFPAFADRIENLSDESLGYTTTEEGIRMIVPKVDTSAQDALKKQAVENLSAWGVPPEMMDNPVFLKRMQDLGRSHETRKYLALKGDTSQLDAAEHTEFATATTSSSMKEVTMNLGKDLQGLGLPVDGAIPPNLVPKYTTQIRQLQTSQAAAMRAQMNRDLIDPKFIDDTIQASVTEPYNAMIKMIEDGDASVLNKKMLDAHEAASKYKIRMEFPEYAYLQDTLGQSGINSEMEAYGKILSEVAVSGGGKNNELYRFSMNNNTSMANTVSVMNKVFGNPAYKNIVKAPDESSAQAAYDAASPDEKLPIKARAEFGFGKDTKIPAEPKALQALKNTAAASAKALIDDSNNTAFSFVKLARKSSVLQDAVAGTPQGVQNLTNSAIFGGSGIINRVKEDSPAGAKFKVVSLRDGSRHLIATSPDGVLLGAAGVMGDYTATLGKSSTTMTVSEAAKRGEIPEVLPNKGKTMSSATMSLVASQMWAIDKYKDKMGQGQPKSHEELFQLLEQRTAPSTEGAPVQQQQPAKEAAKPADESAQIYQQLQQEATAKAQELMQQGKPKEALKALEDAGIPVSEQLKYSVNAAPQKLEPGTYLINGELIEVTS